MVNGKSVVVLQSCYIPWKGYFDAMNLADVFIIYDEMQYTKNDWRNRNKIKTAQGVQWLTIPVRQLNLAQKINETKVANQIWRKKHWKTIKMNYQKAPFFKKYAPIFEALYLKNDEDLLSKINYQFLTTINQILGIDTELIWSSEFDLQGDKTERLVKLCKEVGATRYYSGPAAQSYMDESLFEKEGMKVEYLSYAGYHEYEQLYGEFIHEVSILDLIFNKGPEAPKYMLSFGKKQ